MAAAGVVADEEVQPQPARLLELTGARTLFAADTTAAADRG
ncbi:hypothetical protein [Streptomyces capparidis]